MKKKNNKAKVEVVEPKSVANKCDYQRANGKCGRALSDMFGKLCPGRSCEDWKCDAEGEGPESDGAPSCKHYSEPYGYCVSEKSEHFSHTCHKCKLFEDKWFCGELRCNGTCGNGKSENHNKKCLGENCPDLIPINSNSVAVVATSQTLQTSQTSYKERVSGQYAAIGTAKDNLMRECVKFGALLTEVSYYLGETQGRKGAGLQTWLEENCPEINYKTAMGYKSAAAKFVKMIGGGSQAVAVLQDKTEVIPPGEDAPIEVDAKFIEKRDKLFNDVKSRRDLEQTYFKFMANEGKGRQGGANKGQSGTGRRALTVEEQAKDAADEFREMIGSLFAYVVEQKKVMLLTAEEQDEFIGSLKRIAKSAEEMVG